MLNMLPKAVSKLLKLFGTVVNLRNGKLLEPPCCEG